LKIIKKDVDVWFDKLCEELLKLEPNVWTETLNKIEESINSGGTGDTYYLATYYRHPLNNYIYLPPENVTGDELVDTLYRNRRKYSRKINKPGHKLDGCTICIERIGTDFSGRFLPPDGVHIILKLKKTSECILF